MSVRSTVCVSICNAIGKLETAVKERLLKYIFEDLLTFFIEKKLYLNLFQIIDIVILFENPPFLEIQLRPLKTQNTEPRFSP